MIPEIRYLGRVVSPWMEGAAMVAVRSSAKITAFFTPACAGGFPPATPDPDYRTMRAGGAGTEWEPTSQA